MKNKKRIQKNTRKKNKNKNKKTKRRRRGGQPDPIQKGTDEYANHKRMFLQQLKYAENDETFDENVDDAMIKYNMIIDEINQELPEKGNTKKMSRLSTKQLNQIYNEIETKIMEDFDINPREFEIGLDVFD